MPRIAAGPHMLTTSSRSPLPAVPRTCADWPVRAQSALERREDLSFGVRGAWGGPDRHRPRLHEEALQLQGRWSSLGPGY
eukprot:12281993-Alexandrium_andersonii.AAC.1